MAVAKLTSFKNLGLSNTICGCLEQLNIRTPTAIQRLAIPSMLNGNDNHCLVAQTGTGKTLAYMLPILQDLKTRQAKQGQRFPLPKSPSALVVVPNRELADQLNFQLDVFKQTLNLKAFPVCSGIGLNVVRKELKAGNDLVIGTPEHLERCLKNGLLFFSQVNNVVFDESDTLVDAGYSSAINGFMDKLTKKPRFTFVSATYPKQLEDLIRGSFDYQTNRELPYIKRIMEPNTHLNLTNIHHDLISLKSWDKNPQFLSAIRSYSREIQNGGCIVFCNTIKSANAAEYLLKENGYNSAAFHGDVPSKKRSRNIMQFRSGTVKVLVCTDLGSRGLDFPGVELVIQYDFPKTVSDYLHRVGRTGRCGKLGTAISFFRKKDSDIVAQLKQSFETKKPLTITTSAYSLKNKEDFPYPPHVAKQIAEENQLKWKQELMKKKEKEKEEGRKEGEKKEGAHRVGGRQERGNRVGARNEGGYKVGGRNEGGYKAVERKEGGNRAGARNEGGYKVGGRKEGGNRMEARKKGGNRVGARKVVGSKDGSNRMIVTKNKKK